jgi:hypothetical protein
MPYDLHRTATVEAITTLTARVYGNDPVMCRCAYHIKPAAIVYFSFSQEMKSSIDVRRYWV